MFSAFFLIVYCNVNGKEEGQLRMVDHKDKFIGSTECRTCHEDEYADWMNSHHDLAMQIADSSTILGNFENQIFTHQNQDYRFTTKNGKYYFSSDQDQTQVQEYEIKYTFGVFPLQQYIVEFPKGHYQCLDIAWDSEKNKWFHLQPDMDIATDEWIHWTGGGMRWNTACADCHSTNLHKNFDAISGAFNTTFSEINVGCEACHGPGEEHAKYYAENQNVENNIPPKLYLDTNATSTELVQKCARCHSRRSQLTPYFDYQGHFFDHYEPSLLTEGLYEPDGQIRDEVYVYGSFVQSKMYHLGISCRDCHDVHSQKLKKTGNELCLSCHVQKYDSKEHHFHIPNSDAGQCVNCHMTGEYYMGNDFRRDHSFRVPRPDQTVKYGTPNACNECHTDKSAEWAENAIVKFYGTERAEHFSDYLIPGALGDRNALYQLLAGTRFPEIARATGLNYLGRNLLPDEVNSIRMFLFDSSALVRTQAIRALQNVGDQTYTKLIEPLLSDSFRMVRIAAAEYSQLKSPQDFDPKSSIAGKEYLTSLEFNTDFASGQHRLAGYFESKGQIDDAIRAYRRALEIDNYFNMSRLNLALLLYRQGQVVEAEELYLIVTRQEPEFAYAFYMLGLLYNEQNKIPEALNYLNLARQKDPANFRAWYNYILLLQKDNQLSESLNVISQTPMEWQNSEQLLYVKLLGQYKSGLNKEALVICKKLIEMNPGNQDYQQLLTTIQQQIQ